MMWLSVEHSIIHNPYISLLYPFLPIQIPVLLNPRVGLRCQSTLHQLEAKVLPNEMNQDESYLDHESDAKSKNKEEMGNNDMVRNSVCSYLALTARWHDEIF